MYTYLPYSGFGYSPFGYTYYSPTTVAYAPSYGGSGYTYGGGRSVNVPTHRGAASVMTASARTGSGGALGSRAERVTQQLRSGGTRASAAVAADTRAAATGNRLFSRR